MTTHPQREDDPAGAGSLTGKSGGAPVDLGLGGRRAFVTGGGRGIGRAIAIALADAGCHVAFNYLRNRRSAEETLKELHRRGVKALAVRANLADDDAMAAAFREVGESLGSLDVVVHNAASGVEREAMDISRHHFDWTMGINAWGFLSTVRLAVPLMKDGGSVVAISSLGSIRAMPYYTAVGASKAAIESIARHLAVDLGPRGIRVNIICPGVVDTDALTHFPNRQQLITDFNATSPLGRLVTPQDVASAVLFFASDLSAMVSGATLFVDGGYQAVGAPR